MTVAKRRQPSCRECEHPLAKHDKTFGCIAWDQKYQPLGVCDCPLTARGHISTIAAPQYRLLRQDQPDSQPGAATTAP